MPSPTSSTSSSTTRHSSHYPPIPSAASTTEKCRCEDCVPKNYYIANKRNKQSFMPPSHHIGSVLPDGGSPSIRPPYGMHQQPPQRFLGKEFEDVNLLLKEQQRGFDRFQNNNNNNNKQFSNVNNNNDYKTMNGYHHNPHHQKLSTNPTEMNLKIKERTENALVISIVVDGIYYSGTLLTSLKR